MSELDDAVRRWAQGVYATEAGAELLIRGGKAIYEGAPWLREVGRAGGQRMVAVDADLLYVESAAWSGSEKRITAVAVSMLGEGHLVDLSDATTGMDPESISLILAAIAHASGAHEARMPIIRDQKITGYCEPANLFPWPSKTGESSRRSTRGEGHDDGAVGGAPGRSL